MSEAADGLRIPQNYLSKILHGLVRAGVLESTRGRHGGFRLASRPEDLPLSRVIAPFDRFDRRHRAEVEDFFLRTTIADLRTAPRVPGL